jgi:hypothetical protein
MRGSGPGILLANDGKLSAAAAMSVVVVLVILGIGELLGRAMEAGDQPARSEAPVL